MRGGRIVVAPLLAGVAVVFLFSGLAPRRIHDFRFPANFSWGSATAAHQVEGGNTNNDWYEWEQLGKTRHHAGNAVEHWTRYPEDLDIAKSLNHNAYRMSLEWSRIEPRHGVFSREALLHYRGMLLAARERGLRTFVTLHHFTNPLWASRQGGWANEEMPRWYANYVAYVVPNIGDLVDYWLTINEPNVTGLLGYTVGMVPPGEKDMKKAVRVIANLLKGHAYAYHQIHAFYPHARVGFAHHMRIFRAARVWHPGDHLVAGFVDRFWNKQILSAMRTGHIYFNIPFVINHSERWPELEGTLDFIGINYYTRDLMALNFGSPQGFEIWPNEGVEKTDNEWEIYPEGLYKSIMVAASYGVPVYISENGLADAADAKRTKFICDHLREMAFAIEDGADVRGYLHWSLMDNWEWIDGYFPRFGLVEIDFQTQERKIRPSARVMAEVIASRRLEACRDQLGEISH